MDTLALAKSKAQAWLASPAVQADQAVCDEIKKMMTDADIKPMIDAFYKELTFGTGGLRSLMGAGSNRMNRFTVGKATQGLATYLKKSVGESVRVAIAHDSRNHSRDFALIAANIFSANGIEVFIFSDLRPTPLLSFAIRYLHCHSGLVITASHNPKEYNGYKVYWADGSQLVPPHDENVIEEINRITAFEQVNDKANEKLIKTIGPELEEAYYRKVIASLPQNEMIKSFGNISIVYSSLHGAGITVIPECLKRIGFTNVHIVAEQQQPDGNFPTVKSPNPEEQSAMEMAIKKGNAINAELVMATDPDTDRVGFGIRNAQGEFFLLNGNQAFSLMMMFIMKYEKDTANTYIGKTIVTTELVDQMAKHYGIDCVNTLTGFKYIAELIRNREGKMRFLAAGEESYGYLVGDFVRDKDAVSACAFFAVMAACASAEGKSLYAWLVQMYVDFGYYKESLVNITKKGAEGEKAIKEITEKLRQNPPKTIAGERVTRVLDYLSGEMLDVASNTRSRLDFPKSDVLQYYTDKGGKVSVRPSGTEPKIKYYISVHESLASPDQYEAVTHMLDKRIKDIETDFIQ